MNKFYVPIRHNGKLFSQRMSQHKHMKAKFINPQWNSKCALDPLNAHIPDDEKQQTQRHLKQFGYTRFEPWRGCGRDDFDMLACKE